MSQGLIYGLSALVAVLAIIAFIPRIGPASLTNLPLALRVLLISFVIAVFILLMASVSGWLESTANFEKGRADQIENALQGKP